MSNRIAEARSQIAEAAPFAMMRLDLLTSAI